MRAARTASRCAFTLIEVILALALGAIIIFTIGMAIDIHYRAVRMSRLQVEEAQLARALMGRVAEDLRAAIQSDSAKSGKAADATTAASSTDSTGDASQSSTSSDSTTDSASSFSEVASAVPGLYGDSSQLQIDISRLPRLDQLPMGQADAQPPEPASDVRTVTWYLAPSASAGVGSQQGAGLMRTELDRSVAAWAAGNGTIDDPSGPSLADEVVSLEFRYFDGSAWTDAWDSAAQGGLPTAVEVGLGLRRAAENRGAGSAILGAADDAATAATYRMVVFLPGAHAASTAADSQDSTSTPKDASSASKDASSSGGSGGTPSAGNPPAAAPKPPSPDPAPSNPTPGPSDPNQDPSRGGAS